MDVSSDAACVKADPNLLLRSVKAPDIEKSSKVDSDIGKGWLLLYSELWKWWWRRCLVRSASKSSPYNSFLTNCLTCTIQNLDFRSVRVDFTPPCITRLELSLTERFLLLFLLLDLAAPSVLQHSSATLISRSSQFEGQGR